MPIEADYGGDSPASVEKASSEEDYCYDCGSPNEKVNNYYNYNKSDLHPMVWIALW